MFYLQLDEPVIVHGRCVKSKGDILTTSRNDWEPVRQMADKCRALGYKVTVWGPNPNTKLDKPVRLNY